MSWLLKLCAFMAFSSKIVNILLYCQDYGGDVFIIGMFLSKLRVENKP
jgi:hypothetical protein